jgi:hypothetical protein
MFLIAGVVIALALWGIATPSKSHETICLPPDFSQHKTLTIQVCQDATLYRTPSGGFLVICPGGQPPAGHIEMREYYTRPK